jgi:electron transport complex protein RnfB
MAEMASASDIDALLPRLRAPSSIARIDEAACIGCALCLAACPVDAIVGAAKLMHTVLAADCIGCELCVPPCPVDCISMLRAGRSFTEADAARARTSFERRNARRAAEGTRGKNRAAPPASESGADAERTRRRAAVAAALARARARRARKR